MIKSRCNCYDLPSAALVEALWLKSLNLRPLTWTQPWYVRVLRLMGVR